MGQGYRRIPDDTQRALGWPHGVGCVHCRTHELCNECGGPLNPEGYKRSQSGTVLTTTHCTNGRCAKCHASVCGQGEAHAPYRLKEGAQRKAFAEPSKLETLARSGVVPGRGQI